MGGSAGDALDNVFSLGGTLYDRDTEGIGAAAEGMQAAIMGEKPKDVPETKVDSANPFSRAQLSNTMKRKQKSGFGRRQTFKGLTG